MLSCAHTPEKKEPERLWNTYEENPASKDPSSEDSTNADSKNMGFTNELSEKRIPVELEPPNIEEVPDAKKQSICQSIDRIAKANPQGCQLKRSMHYLVGAKSAHAVLCEESPGKGDPKVLACLEKAQDCDQIGDCFDLPIAHFKRQCSENIWLDFEVGGRIASAPATVGLRYSELAEHYDYSYASGHLSLANIKSTEKEPIELCGPSEMMDWLMHLECPDGSKSVRTTQDTHTYKTGISQAGRCNSRVNNFEIPCGSQTFSHHIDMGACPPGRERYPAGFLEFKKRYRK
jgi:hypothetical protein